MATAIKDGGEASDGEGERETGEGGYDEEKLPLTGKQITSQAAAVIDGEERKVNYLIQGGWGRDLHNIHSY